MNNHSSHSTNIKHNYVSEIVQKIFFHYLYHITIYLLLSSIKSSFPAFVAAVTILLSCCVCVCLCVFCSSVAMMMMVNIVVIPNRSLWVCISCCIMMMMLNLLCSHVENKSDLVTPLILLESLYLNRNCP